jgi:predicted glutamine amidotransferase
MSRMLGYLTPHTSDASSAVGAALLDAFAALARVHQDGWGAAVATASGAVKATWSTEALSGSDELARHTQGDATARLVYLRFASAGSAPATENCQPFVRHGIAFAHNGVLSPRDRAWDLLSPNERSHLRGTTDSEVYFALVIRELFVDETADAADAAARTAARLRALYPDACLNALLLTRDGLVAVQSSAGRPPPLAAFTSRGQLFEDLPPGHGPDYNALATTTLNNGTIVVCTSGVEREGWRLLPEDSVTRITAAGETMIPL